MAWFILKRQDIEQLDREGKYTLYRLPNGTYEWGAAPPAGAVVMGQISEAKEAHGQYAETFCWEVPSKWDTEGWADVEEE